MFRKHPLVALRSAWEAYLMDEMILSEAASAVGISPKQFLELGTRSVSECKTRIPDKLWVKANDEERFLMACLHPRQVSILCELAEKEILISRSEMYSSLLWEDLHLLTVLGLVSFSHNEEGWHYKLQLGKRSLLTELSFSDRISGEK